MIAPEKYKIYNFYLRYTYLISVLLYLIILYPLRQSNCVSFTNALFLNHKNAYKIRI